MQISLGKCLSLDISLDKKGFLQAYLSEYKGGRTVLVYLWENLLYGQAAFSLDPLHFFPFVVCSIKKACKCACVHARFHTLPKESDNVFKFCEEPTRNKVNYQLARGKKDLLEASRDKLLWKHYVTPPS